LGRADQFLKATFMPLSGHRLLFCRRPTRPRPGSRLPRIFFPPNRSVLHPGSEQASALKATIGTAMLSYNEHGKFRANAQERGRGSAPTFFGLAPFGSDVANIRRL
jgi:hypothetical protein